MKKRLLSSLLAMCLLVGLLPSVALAAEDEAEYTTEAGATDVGSFADAVANVNDGGTITLRSDVETTGQIDLSGKSVTLLGEGHTITLANKGIVLGSGAVLHLGQEDYTETLTICSSGTTYALFNLQDDAKMDMYPNVTLGPSSSMPTTGGVHLSDTAEFTMYGGTITDCHSIVSISGAVSVTDNGTFHMVDGLIEGCSGWEGGAVSLHPGPAIGGGSYGMPTFQMEGGIIRNCTDHYRGGGAIYADTGSQPIRLLITDGRIEYCSAENTSTGYGGAISLWSNNVYQNEIKISGLTLLGNNATQCGGAIFCSVPNAEISNVIIEKNTAGKDGGGIYLNKGTLECESLFLIGNTAVSGSGGGAYLAAGKFQLGDNARVTENKAEAGSGGGIYRSSSASFSVGNGGLIQGNIAASGGGIAISNSSGGANLMGDLQIYDNVASVEGDDIRFNGSGYLMLPDVPTGAALLCSHTVDGWYHDTEDSRWGIADCGASDGTVSYVDAWSPLMGAVALKAAHEEIIEYTITVSVQGNGTVSPAGSAVTVTAGENKTFTFTPEKGHHVADVLVDGKSVGVMETYTFSEVKSEHSLSVIFAPNTYILTYESNGGTAYAPETYTENTLVSLDKIPQRTGYVFTGWYADEALTQRVTSVTMDKSKTVYAGWEIPYLPPIPNPIEPEEPAYSPDGLNTQDHFAYLVGYEDGTVRPEGRITRAEVATIFFRLLTDETREAYWSQDSGYSDVTKAHWFNNAVSTLTNMGILSGDGDGTFRPNDPITRAEFAKIAVSFYDYEGIRAENVFTDVAPGIWYEWFVAAAAEIGLIQGDGGGIFRPEDNITRAEAAAIVNRTLNRAPHKEHLLPEEIMITWPDNQNTEKWYYADMQEATNSHDFTWTRAGSEVVEQWTEKLEERDWAALEKIWSTGWED